MAWVSVAPCSALSSGSKVVVEVLSAVVLTIGRFEEAPSLLSDDNPSKDFLGLPTCGHRLAWGDGFVSDVIGRGTPEGFASFALSLAWVSVSPCSALSSGSKVVFDVELTGSRWISSVVLTIGRFGEVLSLLSDDNPSKDFLFVPTCGRRLTWGDGFVSDVIGTGTCAFETLLSNKARSLTDSFCSFSSSVEVQRFGDWTLSLATALSGSDSICAVAAVRFNT